MNRRKFLGKLGLLGGFFFIPWSSKGTSNPKNHQVRIMGKRIIYRYATPREMNDPSIHKYDLEGTPLKAIRRVEAI